MTIARTSASWYGKMTSASGVGISSKKQLYSSANSDMASVKHESISFFVLGKFNVKLLKYKIVSPLIVSLE